MKNLFTETVGRVKVLFIVLAVIFMCGCGGTAAFADLSTSDMYEIDNATPGLSKVFAGKGLGHMLQGLRLTATYTGTIDSNSPNTTAPAYRLVMWNVPTLNYSIPLGTGLSGQRLTIIKNNTGTTPGKVSPSSKTGFTDVTLTNQGDGVTLEWHDSTGWMPVGVFGGSSTVAKVNP